MILRLAPSLGRVFFCALASSKKLFLSLYNIGLPNLYMIDEIFISNKAGKVFVSPKFGANSEFCQLKTGKKLAVPPSNVCNARTIVEKSCTSFSKWFLAISLMGKNNGDVLH